MHISHNCKQTVIGKKVATVQGKEKNKTWALENVLCGEACEYGFTGLLLVVCLLLDRLSRKRMHGGYHAFLPAKCADACLLPRTCVSTVRCQP